MTNPADDFAAILQGAGVSAEAAPIDEGPRVPAPNLMQGTSDGGSPPVDPASMFTHALREAIGRSATNPGGWYGLHSNHYRF